MEQSQELLQTEQEDITSQVKLQVPCEIYSRVVGYLRPVQNWNKGKQQEFSERKTYRAIQKPQ